MRFAIDDRKLLGVLALVGAIIFRKPLVATALPFLIAFGLAALMDPVFKLLRRRLNAPRPVAAGVSLVLFVLAGGYVFLLISTKVLSELVQMGARLRNYQHVPVDLATNIIRRLNELNEVVDQRGLPPAVQQNIIQAVDNLARTGVSLVSQGIDIVLNAVGSVPALVVVVVIAMIAAYFIVKDREQLTESALALAPPSWREQMRTVEKRVSVDLISFFRAQLILFILTTIFIGLGLAAIGVDYWLSLALIAAILDVIPVVGPGFLFIPWAIGAVTLGQTALAIKLLVIMGLHFLLRQVLQAKILGDSIGVHPLPMLAALYAGVRFFGIEGFIVAPILVILAKALYSLREEA